MSTKSAPCDVVVVGSTNVDLVMQVATLPAPGETVGDAAFAQLPGGKGANQATASARAGARTVFVSRVGRDAYGREARDRLQQTGVDASLVSGCDEPTGTALIFVDAQGENCIGVAPGANALCNVDKVSGDEECRAYRQARVVLLQLEIPLDAVERVLSEPTDACKIVNAAPAQALTDAQLSLIDLLVVNEVELFQVRGQAAADGERSQKRLERACAPLHASGVAEIVVTLGADGVYVSRSGHGQRMPGFKVEAVDTTGAGDTFCGALAAALARGDGLVHAVRYAQASAALACTALGAQTAMPERAQVEQFLEAP